MSKLKGIVAATALGAATAFGSVAVAETSTSIGVNSSYMFRGVDAAGGSQFWGSLDYTSGGAYMGGWLAGQSSATFQEELDIYGGYNIALSEGLGLDLGAVYYIFPEERNISGLAPGVETGNNAEIYAGLSGGMWDAYLYYNFGADNGIEDDEAVHIATSVSVGNIDLRLGHTMGIGDTFDDTKAGSTAAAGADDSYTNIGVTFNQDVGDFGSVSLSVDVTDIDDSPTSAGAGQSAWAWVVRQSDHPQFTLGWSKTFN